MSIGSRIKSAFGHLFDVDSTERSKLIYLTLTFFLVIGSYTIVRDIKNSIFISIVGRYYVNWARMIVMFTLVPLILFYSRLVDSIRRYQLLMYYSLAFGLISLIFAYFLGHPTIGLPNTNQDPWRIFGWLFYFFGESYSPFVVSIFWSFANSINSPESARNNYGLMVAGSKLGGMVTAGLAWYMFSDMASKPYNLSADVWVHQLVFMVSSVVLLMVPVAVYFLMKRVPGAYLHGYEAAYQVEKQKAKQKDKAGLFEGLIMLIKYPYVMGIFSLILFYEILGTVLGYIRLGIAESGALSVSAKSAFLFQTVFMTHAVGFFISFIGTRELLRRLGTRFCLLLIPLISGTLLLYFMFLHTESALVIAFALLKSVNYAFSWPVRESLYIPTIKDIKFKSKSWIDAFGAKFAKTGGSSFNMVVEGMSPALYMPIHAFFFSGIILLWFFGAYWLGKRFDKAVMNNEVIGVTEENSE